MTVAERDTSVEPQSAHLPCKPHESTDARKRIVSPATSPIHANGLGASSATVDQVAAVRFGDTQVLPRRFLAKVELHDDDCECCDGCWIWTAAVTFDGYGRYRVGPRMIRAHRFAYELLIGEIADGLVLDHLCRRRGCVNPWHLEPVSGAENTRRGEPANSRKTECAAGHAYDRLNTRLTPDGRRHCRRCEREQRLNRNLERRQEAA